MTPAQSHQNWMDLKVAQGWTHGYVKEPSLKKHPCIAPYDALPREQRAKYSIFRGVVLACLSVAAPGTLPTRHAVGAQQSLPLEP